jgi:hypothetical protein
MELLMRGAGQKKSTDPPVNLLSINPRPTHPPPSGLFSPLAFLLVRFWAFLGKGSSKTPYKYFLQKVDVDVENFFQKNRQKFRSVFDFFCFVAFSGVSQRREFKNTTKNVSQKNVSKSFAKNSTETPKLFFSRFLLSRFWAFLGEGSSKTR